MGIGVMGPGSRFAWPGRRIHFSNNQTISNANPRSRGAFAPEVCWKFPYPPIRGRREYRVHAAPAVSCATVHKTNAHEHTGSAEAIRHALRNGLRLISRSPRRSGFLVTVAGGVLTANLTPASRRQDHTTSPSAFVPFVNGTISVHRIPRPTSVTIAKRPSFGTGPNSNIPVSTRPSSDISEIQK